MRPSHESDVRPEYHPGFLASFGSFEDALAFWRSFLTWYDADYRHSALG